MAKLTVNLVLKAKTDEEFVENLSGLFHRPDAQEFAQLRQRLEQISNQTLREQAERIFMRKQGE